MRRVTSIACTLALIIVYSGLRIVWSGLREIWTR